MDKHKDPKGKWLIDYIRNNTDNYVALAKSGVTSSIHEKDFGIVFQASSNETRFDMLYDKWKNA